MRGFIFAAMSGAVFSLAPVAALADGQVQQLQPAGYNPSTHMVCIYLTHEGMLIRRPICQSAEAWRSQREHDQQVFRDQLRVNLTRNQ